MEKFNRKPLVALFGVFVLFFGNFSEASAFENPIILKPLFFEKAKELSTQNQEFKFGLERQFPLLNMLELYSNNKTIIRFHQSYSQTEKSQTVLPTSPPIEESEVVESAELIKEYMYANGYIRVRDSDSKKSSEKYLLEPEQKVEVLEKSNNFVKVQVDDMIGYVLNNEFLSDTKKQAKKISEKKKKEVKLTGYCPCFECSEGWGKQTMSGKTAKANHTVAADLSVFDLNTEVFVEGNRNRRYKIEDVGGGVKGNHLDIFVESHSECYDVTEKVAEVYEIEG